jgi:large subunit ribosomal protein L9
MKVILNQDVKHLGEEGDVKTVANGYARNYLFPRNLALPYNTITIQHFESKKSEIEERKNLKRNDAQSRKEKLEAFTVELVMSSGPTGKLYGAVTNQTIVDELTKNGFEIERKRIEIPGLTIKHTGKYTAIVHLYETSSANITVVVVSQEELEAKKRKDAAEAKAAQRAAEKASAEQAKAAVAAEAAVTAVAATEASTENTEPQETQDS